MYKQQFQGCCLYVHIKIIVSHYILNLFKTLMFFSCSNIRENTIASMKDAVLHGADMVEFDVQVNITVQYIYTVHVYSSVKLQNFILVV